MYTANISHGLHHQKVLETSARLLRFLTLLLKCAVHKDKDDNETFSYFLHLIKKGSAVLDIGAHNDDYLYLILKIAKRAGRFIAFESEPDMYDYFLKKKEILKLKNATIEHLVFSEETGKTSLNDLLSKKNGATIIDFKTWKNREAKKATADTLYDYCTAYDIEPDFLKISGEENTVSILKGAAKVLQKYKPKILLQCEERHAGRLIILQAFKLLADLRYSGYFILDVVKIPIANFDFNTYQNPHSNFYCKYFIFE